MRKVRNHDLTLLAAMAALLPFITYALPGTPFFLRIPFAVFVVLFVPGLLTVSAAFPQSSRFSSPERVGLAAILSILVGAGIALLAGTLVPAAEVNRFALFLIALYCVLAAGLALARRRGPVARRAFELSVLPSAVLPIAAGVGVLIASISLMNYTWRPAATTTFFVLNAHGELGAYPSTAMAGSSIVLKFGVLTTLPGEQDFTIRLMSPGAGATLVKLQVVGGRTWTGNADVPVPPAMGSRTLQFGLFDGGHKSPIRTLSLKLTVLPSTTLDGSTR